MSEAIPKPEAPKPGHEANGRFAKGNADGPGNPFGRRVAELRQVILDALTDAELIAVTRSMIERAKKGDVAAARLLLQYSLGKPAAAVQPDRIDIDEFELRRDSSVDVRDWVPMMANSLEADLVNRMTDPIWWCMQQKTLEPLKDGFPEPDGSPSPAEKRAAKKAARKAERLARRRGKTRVSPSPNGANGDGAKDPFDTIRRGPDGQILPYRAG